jgi:glycosyltransferase involved in cell wall biosynthesis
VKLRVLHVIYDDPQNPWVAGGGSVRVFELYRRLTDRVDVQVITARYPRARDQVVDGVQYLRRGARRPYWWSRLTYGYRASRLLRSADYDAAVFDFSTYTPIFVPTNRPVGITVHHLTGPTSRHRWGRPLGGMIERFERASLRRATRFSATSRATAELLAGVAPTIPIDLVYAGVSDELFELARRPGDYLLYFGRLDVFQKGIDTLLEALVILARTRPAIELRIAGRGKDTHRVTRMVSELGLARNVQMLGPVAEEERQSLFAGAAVQLMPSRFEGFGMVAAEAMAAGVPLVAASTGSLPEVVDAPRGGLLVPPDDPPALAAAVQRLLDSPGERDALSRSARTSAERFRWSSVATDHLSFLKHIAESPGGRSTIPDA